MSKPASDEFSGMRQIAVQLETEELNMPQLQKTRTARLEARISPELKRLLEYAASLRGSSLTEFVVQSAQEAASSAIREREILTLAEGARTAFAQFLLNPPRPNRNALNAAKRYKAQFAKQLAGD